MTNRMRLYLNRMNHFDSALCVKVSHTSQYRVIRDWFRLMSRLGDGVFWYTLLIGILLVQGMDALLPVLHIAATGLSGTLVYKWLKGKTLRPRPYQVLQDVLLTGKPLDYFSFPSGHTLHAAAFTCMILAYYPSLAMLIVPFSLMVAVSRVVLGLHYPSDVLAGALIGCVMSLLSMSIVFI
ncbi:MAG: phosphatase PAP2 family protein [Methylophilaceae bacterium]